MKTHALAVFRQAPQRLNCAQAVLAGYQAVTGDRSLALETLKPHGAGRAPDGLCGSLHAACVLAPARAPEIKAAFAAQIGALRCKDITRPCPECVAAASDLLAANTPAS